MKPEKVLAPGKAKISQFYSWSSPHILNRLNLVIVNSLFLLTLKGTVWTVQCTNNKNYSAVIKNELNQVLRRSCKTWLLANLSSAKNTSPLSNTDPNTYMYATVLWSKSRKCKTSFCHNLPLKKNTFKTSVGLQIADETAPAITPAITL